MHKASQIKAINRIRRLPYPGLPGRYGAGCIVLRRTQRGWRQDHCVSAQTSNMLIKKVRSKCVATRLRQTPNKRSTNPRHPHPFPSTFAFQQVKATHSTYFNPKSHRNHEDQSMTTTNTTTAIALTTSSRRSSRRPSRTCSARHASSPTSTPGSRRHSKKFNLLSYRQFSPFKPKEIHVEQDKLAGQPPSAQPDSSARGTPSFALCQSHFLDGACWSSSARTSTSTCLL